MFIGIRSRVVLYSSALLSRPLLMALTPACQARHSAFLQQPSHLPKGHGSHGADPPYLCAAMSTTDDLVERGEGKTQDLSLTPRQRMRVQERAII